MNKNQINGTVKDIVGTVQEKAGQLIGNPSQEAKGLQKQVQGRAKKRLGDIQEIIKDAKEAT